MRALLIVAALTLAQGVLACGYCVEDRIAAAYDHAVIVSALDRRHAVAFLSVEGTLAKSQERQVAKAVESTAGVDKGTVRVSLENGAVSFAFDPSRHRLSSIVNRIDRELAPKSAGVRVLKIVKD